MTTNIINVIDDALPGLANKINEATTAAESHARSAMQYALTAGELLVQAKSLVPHGEWQQWVEANCTIAPRTASAYMRLSARLPELPEAERQRVADLPLRDAIRAIGTSAKAPPRGGMYYPPRDDEERTAAALLSSSRALQLAARELQFRRELKSKRVESLRSRLRAALDLLDKLVTEATR